MDLDSVADELYGLMPDQFVASRNTRADEARGAGQRELAAAIKKLRRPTAGAWLANVLARERSEQLAELLDLGAAMRQAQADLAGGELRRLAQQRRRLVAALGEEASRLGRDNGRPVSDASSRELAATLEAAVADPGAAEAMRRGRLETALRYSGFGPSARTESGAATAGRPAQDRAGSRETAGRRAQDRAGSRETAGRRAQDRAASRRSAGSRQPARADWPQPERRRGERLRQARRELREAETAEAGAQRDAAQRERRLLGARSERDQLRGRVAALEGRLQELRAAGEQAERAVRDAVAERDAAGLKVRSARDRADRARAALGRLTAGANRSE